MKYYILILFFSFHFVAFCQVDGIIPSTVEVKDDNIPLRSGPSHDAELIVRVPLNEKFDLLNVDLNGYFKVKNQKFDGYIFYVFLKNGEKIFFQAKQNLEGPKRPFDEAAEIRKNDSIADIVNRKAKEEGKAYFDSLRIKVQQDINKRRPVFVKKYGTVNGEKVAKGLIWIGMTEEMLLDSWGQPEDINTTVTRYGTRKQYVYGSGQYVYVENGKVDAWQD
jgi:hypothetical protein